MDSNSQSIKDELFCLFFSSPRERSERGPISRRVWRTVPNCHHHANPTLAGLFDASSCVASGDCKQKHKKTLHLDRVQPLERNQRLHLEDLIRCILPTLITPGGRVVIGGQVERNDLASNRSKYMELKIKKEKQKKEQGILTREFFILF